jgi:hypothetical protein
VPFTIIAAQRTGSSHLVSMLGGHPEIICHGNVFAPAMMPVFWPKDHSIRPAEAEKIRNELSDLKASNSLACLKRLFATDFGRPHVGFKIFAGQDDKVLNKVLKKSAIRKIVLFRPNVLASYASGLAASKTKKWALKEGREQREVPKVSFDKEDFIKYHNETISFYSSVMDRLLELREPYYTITYNELNDPLLFRGLVNFIGADTAKQVRTSEQRRVQVKQNSPDILSRFSNSEEVHAFLSVSGLLSWVYEGEISIAKRWEEESSQDTSAESQFDDDPASRQMAE